ncbi:MAG TPA: hypothetical protein VMV47_08165 [Bacteroidales bacterium]|nr:hypothetical protein [Bacteroidales bacterium]
MIELNFVAIGKIPGEAIFIHKDDTIHLDNPYICYGTTYTTF